MSEIIAGGAFMFSDPNTPTRVGEFVENAEDILNIPNPRIGMQVYVIREERNYTITKLKDKVINGVTVPNAAVAEYKDKGLSEEDKQLLEDSVDGNDISFSRYEDKVDMEFSKNSGNVEYVSIPAATTTEAGVMSATDKMQLQKLIDNNFPLQVMLSANPSSSSSNALDLNNAPTNITISWRLQYKGNSNYEDASKFNGVLKIGSETIQMDGSELGKGNKVISLSNTTAINLTINGKSGSTTVYFAKPMYSVVLPIGDSLSIIRDIVDKNKISPIATSIADMGNQTITGLSEDYVYWIVIPNNMEIKNSKDVNTGFAFGLEEVTSIPNSRVYKSGGLKANSNWVIKLS